MMRRVEGWGRVKLALWSVSAAILVVALPLAAGAEVGRAGQKTAAVAGPADGLPKISLTDQNGRTVMLSSLKGKPALVAFIHTSCEGPCELITAEMKSVARSLGPEFKSDVTMISITTEPKEDRSRELLAYAKAQGVDADGWVFVTGTPEEIRGLLSRYGVLAEQSHSDHVLDLFLLDADGAAVRRYSGVATRPQMIAADVRKTASLH
jgi:protein SCO1